MKLNIKEFNEQYPHYNLGFKASNPKTKTEEVYVYNFIKKTNSHKKG